MVVAAALSNTGPLTELAVGGDGAYDVLGAEVKWLLCLAMLVGRLEIFAFLAVLVGKLRRT